MSLLSKVKTEAVKAVQPPEASQPELPPDKDVAFVDEDGFHWLITVRGVCREDVVDWLDFMGDELL